VDLALAHSSGVFDVPQDEDANAFDFGRHFAHMPRNRRKVVTSRPADEEHPRRHNLEARWQNCVLPRSWRPCRVNTGSCDIIVRT